MCPMPGCFVDWGSEPRIFTHALILWVFVQISGNLILAARLACRTPRRTSDHPWIVLLGIDVCQGIDFTDGEAVLQWQIYPCSSDSQSWPD